MNDDHKELYQQMRNDPLFFVRKVWNLEVEMDNEKFEKGKHISWQQAELLEAVRAGLHGEKPPKISVASGRGIGKTCFLAWVVLWSLFRERDSQVACTAPSSQQMYDVLWKEIARWINRMPKDMNELYEFRSEYIRMAESPYTWFASAKTGKKENPEALAGVHGDFVVLVGDEASGVPDEIFKTAEEGLTDGVYLMILISNYRRLEGYFHNSQKDTEYWQTFQFSGLDSPVRDRKKARETLDKYGEDSDTYRIEVLGLPPKEGAIDDKGFVNLLGEPDLNYTHTDPMIGEVRMGVDPSGEGRNETIWVIRDKFKARMIAREVTSSPKSIAEKTLTLAEHFNVAPEHIWVDNFGIGANVAVEAALSGLRINPINVADRPDDPTRFINQRAEAYWRMKEALKTGFSLIGEDWSDLLSVKYKRNLQGKIQIMSKLDMKKLGIPSPDVADALMLTYVMNDMNTFRKRTAPRKPRWIDPRRR